MKTNCLPRALTAFGGLLLFIATPVALAAQTQGLHGHVPAIVKSLPSLGRFPGTNHLSLAIGLPLRNQAALSNLLRQIYDPASPNYRHYLTPEQFTERFGPTEADYQAVIAFAGANGLQITGTHPNRVLLDVSGSVTDVERALHVTMQTFRHPTENRTFYAPDTEPSLDLGVPILHISGLDNYSLPRPRLVAKPLVNGQNASPSSGSGPNGNYMGGDFRAAYVPDTTLTGSGQIVGLLQFDGYTASDITYYESLAGLPNVTLQNVLLDGFSGTPTGSGGEVEVSLDIEMAISMATNLSKVIVYEAGPYGNWHDILNRMANDNLAKQLSCSWYSPGAGSDAVADVIFQQMAAQGQSFFNASGDDDAWTGLIPFPGDTPYITQVGGTTLTTSGPGGSWSSETVWNWGGGIGSGGGISTQYPIPAWQTNISMTANQGSTTKRNTPDVALTADTVYVRADGRNYSVGGTSCAAPLWAGFAALVNQQATAASRPAIGFINPAVDAIGTGANYTSVFHDITTGNNTWSGSPTKFYAVGGYDLCTGWGTPAGQALINALANPEALLIAPPTGFTSSGGFGGPFTITSQTLSLTNAGTNSLTWMLANSSAWLTASSIGGTLTPGGPAATVTVSLNSAASNLVVGIYNATLWFTNLNDSVGQSRQFTLSVISPPAITTQPANQAVLEGATATFTVAATGGLPLAYQWQDNGTNLTDGGNIFGSTTTNLIVSDVSAADVGTYTVVVTNVAGAVTSSNALLTIIPSAPVITMQPADETVVVEGTARFAVIAVGTKPLSYQWSFDGTNIVDATNATLTLANVQFSQAGAYGVVVTNIYGSTNSSDAVLTVIPCDPAPSGLVAWWPAEGNANDIEGGNNGSPAGALGYTKGEVGQAFVFDGSTSYIPVPASSSLDIGAGSGITIECWIQPNAYNVNVSGAPIIEWDSATTDGLEFWSQGSLFANVIDTSGTAHRLQTADGLVSTNSLQHVALTYDKSSGLMVIYYNGMAVTNASIGNVTPQTTYPVNIGRRTGQPIGDGDTYGGLMDELSLYNRALSSNEIAAIYNAGSGGKCPMPPTITTQPANQTVYVGNTANFIVTVSGTLPLTYQWNFDGTNIVGATNNLLVLTNAQFSQSGIYAVQVANVCGSVQSSNALLTVNPPPSCDPAPSGLVAWWPAEGNANDIEGGNNGSPVSGITYTNGKVGQAFVFDGATSLITVPASPSLAVSNLTFEGWIFPTDLNQPRPVIDYGGGGQAVPVCLWINTSGGSSSVPGAIYALIRDRSNINNFIQVIAAGGTVTLNQWNHVAFTYDTVSRAGVLYCNGVQVQSGTSPAALVPQSAPVNLGYRDVNSLDILRGYRFAGRLDEISVYNRALSSNEVAAIYNADSGGKCFTPTPPVITSQPANQTVSVGSTASFSVTANGTPPLTYQWSFNGTNILGATGTTLTFANAQLTNAGSYSVTVTNLYGSATSSNALLTVNSPPSCDPAPSGLVAWWQAEGNANDSIGTNNGTLIGGVTYTNGEVGRAFMFDNVNTTTSYIKASASPSLNIGTNGGFTIECWVKPDALVLQGGAPIIEWDSSSTDGLQFWVGGPSANIKDTSGSAHFINPASNVLNSNNFQHVALTYDKSSGKAFIYYNGGVIASNNFGNITPQTTYPVNIGRRTGQPIGNGSNYGGLMDELSLYNRALTAAEIQAIYAAGSGGKCPPSAPFIVTQPTNQAVALGSTATFTVVAGGTAPLSYRWRFNGTNIAGATNTTLAFVNVQPTNAGTYSVMVTNAYGSVTSSNAVLTVLTQPPSIITQPTNLTMTLTSNATFNVVAAGSPQLIYQWNFNGTNILAATNTSLTLTNVRLSQSGNYSVLVTNAYGSILSSNAALVVNPLLYFIWNQVPSPRFANTPFAVVIQAQNLTNGIVTNFTGTVVLLSTNGVPVSPAVSGNFIQGVWTGAVTVAQTATNLVLQATDNPGDSGLANPINVVSLPTLSPLSSGGTLLILWPVSPSGFVLETTAGLAPANWVPVTAPPFQIGDQYLLSIQMSGTNAFYRLRFNGQ